jgi:hypothetical protein
VIALSEPFTDATAMKPKPQLVEAADPYSEWEPDEDDLLDMLYSSVEGEDDEEEWDATSDQHRLLKTFILAIGESAPLWRSSCTGHATVGKRQPYRASRDQCR